MNTISVIIPCYNVAPYLQCCVNSILNQTYVNLEVILVDDGSTDETGTLCDELLQLDKRIKVVHKNNGGLSDARNAGIDVATGDFLSFVDGADYLELNAYELMVAEMQNAEVSLVSAGILGEDVNGNKSALISGQYLCLTKEEAFINLLGSKRTIGQSSCNKLFRKELFATLRYKKGIINEDMEILPKILDLCNKIVLLNIPIYHYIKRSGSITELEFSLWKYQSIHIADDTLAFCKQKYPDLVPYAYYYRLDSLNKMYEEIVNSINRKSFWWKEFVIRVKICYGYCLYIRNKTVRNMYGKDLKNLTIRAFLGIGLTDKLVRFKENIMGVGDTNDR